MPPPPPFSQGPPTPPPPPTSPSNRSYNKSSDRLTLMAQPLSSVQNIFQPVTPSSPLLSLPTPYPF